ncbi:MAG: hypothetical protein AVDCRST_MAG60-2329 [uncultured Nocardioides sp.]|uniref:Uncharacterized protein n=1 Tax=uncultured Nocardioides sp. TaxID=198441 RepID=A0A6J4P3H4_9ACTN|nr:MAG: hypothetical protein AVDCRST_MAG60-2329 [uncultured Nocardioides sp.]
MHLSPGVIRSDATLLVAPTCCLDEPVVPFGAIVSGGV